MRSKHVDFFNHDPWAADYDANVRNETDPIRAGYANVLAWTVEQANIGPASVVVDLGSGTGNTSAQLTAVGRLICVDISPKMTERARPKLAHLEPVEYVEADLLDVFRSDPPAMDALISTYAIHHLTWDEKQLLFDEIWRHLKPGGYAVFGDLMFADADEQALITAAYQAVGEMGLVADFEEEFFWHVDEAREYLAGLGFTLVETRRFSNLSWGICVRRPVGDIE